MDVFRHQFKAYLSVGFLLFMSFLQAQDQNKADSLVKVYKSNILEDSIQLVILKDIAFHHGNPDSIIYYSKRLIELSTRLSNQSFIANGYYILGSSYRLIGEYKKATDILFQAIKKYELNNNKSGVASTFTALGDVYNAMNDHNNSALYYKKAITEFRVLKDSTKLASALLNLGDEYFNHEELDSALTYLLESKDIFIKQKYEIGIAYAVGNIGLVYANFGENELAEGHINQATEILEKLGDLYPVAVYQTYMADIYKEKGDIETALQYAKRSLQISEKEGLKEQIRDASLKLSEMYYALKDYERAYQYQTQYLTFRDSINNEQTIRKIADLRTEYEVSKKQIEVDLLNKTTENQRFLVINLILIVLLITALAYLYYNRGQVRLKVNKLKSSQKLEMEAQRDQLELLNETKDKFFSIISHDLRAPVGNFKGVSTLMKMLVEANDKDDLIQLCEQLDKSASELISLLDNLLQWALSQQGKFPFTPEKIEAHELVSSTFMVLENMAKTKNIEMTHYIAGKIDLFVDKNSAETIIRNLLSNALKFTPYGGKVSLNISTNVNMAEFIIKDTGVGMPPAAVKSLFDFKAKKSEWGTAGEKGVGLGLTLVKDFVKLNEGSVQVESEVGVGTVFTLDLPLA